MVLPGLFQNGRPPLPPGDPSDTLYLSGLPADVTDDLLRQVMGQYGTIIQCKVLPDIGKPDRVALLRMGTLAQAMWLVDNLNQNIPLGLSTPITVQYAQNKSSRSPEVAQQSLLMSSLSAAAGFGAPATSPSGASTMTGKVKIWHEHRGFGFIIPDRGGPDVFIHVRELVDGQALVQGAPVTYEVQVDASTGRHRAMRCRGAVIAPQGGPAVAQAGGAPGPSDNLFMAGLPAGCTEELVRQVFGQYGTILSCRVLLSERPDAACLLRMGSVDQAKWLVDNVNGNIPIGLATPVTIKFAEDRSRMTSFSPQPQGFAGGFGKSFDVASMARSSPYDVSSASGPASSTQALSEASLALAYAQLGQLSQAAPTAGAASLGAPGTLDASSLGLTSPARVFDAATMGLASPASTGLASPASMGLASPAQAGLASTAPASFANSALAGLAGTTPALGFASPSAVAGLASPMGLGVPGVGAAAAAFDAAAPAALIPGSTLVGAAAGVAPPSAASPGGS